MNQEKDRRQKTLMIRYALVWGCLLAIVTVFVYFVGVWIDPGSIESFRHLLFKTLFWFVGGIIIGVVNWRVQKRT